MKRRFSFAISLLLLASVGVRGDSGIGSGGSVANKSTVGVRLGTNAPDFSAEDERGKNVSLRDYTNQFVVLEWFDPACEYTRRDYKAKAPRTLAEKYRDQKVVWLAINSTRESSRDHNRAWVKEHDLAVPVIDDGKQRIARTYGITTVPAYVIVDRVGKVVYTGAINDDENRGGQKQEGVIEYVDRALGELTTGKAVSKPFSRLFGCPLVP